MGGIRMLNERLHKMTPDEIYESLRANPALKRTYNNYYCYLTTEEKFEKICIQINEPLSKKSKVLRKIFR